MKNRKPETEDGKPEIGPDHFSFPVSCFRFPVSGFFPVWFRLVRVRGISLLAWCVATAVCFSAVARAPAAVTPLERTRTTLENARQIVASERDRNQKLAELFDLLRGFLDTDTMGRTALGDNWSKFSPAQQQEFLTLFRELFQRTYVQKLLLFEQPDFAYLGETVGRDEAQVDTKILTPRDEFLVAYMMRRRGDEWLATDIKIEDLSLTMNFRRQLDRLLSRSSVENVLDRMRRRYGPGGAGGDDEDL
jgi:phospholipid transport system substrate-binding protein